VLSVFQDQISRGGPVTVTHPEMRRYFMTIHGAVHLVLQAIKLGEGGEVFVLDMGEPLRIADIARELIALSGLELGRDINIVFTGVRAGEKLNEELFKDGDYQSTSHPKILVLPNSSGGSAQKEIPHESQNANSFGKAVEALIRAARLSNREQIFQLLKQIVPEYKASHDAFAATVSVGKSTN